MVSAQTLGMNAAKPVVFISYAREDEAAARRLRIGLKRIDAIPWQDRTHLIGGESWKRDIRTAIREADYFIPLLSHVSVNKRGFVQSEVKEALEEVDRLPPDSKYILPCRLDDCHPRHEGLNEFTWIDMFPNWRNGFARIKLAIELQQQSPFPPGIVRSQPQRDTTSTPSPREVRISLSLDAHGMEALEALQGKLSASSQADVIRRALSILNTVTSEAERGRGVTVLRNGYQVPLPFIR